ncbi:2-hydroxyacid dehydrogenase [Pseudoclavibacter sp. AY1F1]|uniref:NAD(P)-dependent oxidoreductase n=1 Tax=Pseudoclavibacter sp. AY1F1 TaxID=2080583 RepID=UPI000CE760CD|nr:NAD(P)-dependent oxidoreductase [Pseudoclavibacter sp. AY1F1]PPF44893.1 2-hydroxyacid dehydrogenase [Pseudoclavibacter sp. AY1F1]
MTRPLVIFTDTTDLSQEPAARLLREAGYATAHLELPTSPGLDAVVPREHLDAVAAVVGYARITADVLAQLPSLRLLATSSVGTDMIDADAAAARGVKVVTLAGVATEEVAAHALTLLLAAERSLLRSLQLVRSGEWTDEATARLQVPRRLSSLTLGLVGLGRIGGRLAEIARPSFGRVLAFDPYAKEAPEGVELVESLDELLAASDSLSLHLPLTAESRGIIGNDALALLPAGAVVVNVSRAGLVDETAIQAALASGALRTYAADVLDGEPPHPSDSMRTDPGTVITPHTAWWSDAALAGYETQPALNIIAELGAPADPNWSTQ